VKVLIVNESDTKGGAARAALRLHNALMKLGVDSNMLVQNKYGSALNVVGPVSRWQKIKVKMGAFIESLPVTLYRNRTKTHFSSAWLSNSRMVKRINSFNADIVHLHWINSGMLGVSDVNKIHAPVIWTMHDNWLFTGGCHIKWECERYKEHCGECPRLGSSRTNDISRITYQRKKMVLSRMDKLIVTAPSRWLQNLAKESSLLRSHQIMNIPNMIDTDVFKSFDGSLSRKLWNLPTKKKIILFGAINSTNDVNKGYKELVGALLAVNDQNIELVVFGSSNGEISLSDKYNTHFLGHISDDVSLVTLYNSADVVVVPSLQENLSYTIMESLACGTPVVAFDVGGNRDLIDHKVNGYLASPFNTLDLATGIEWVLNNPDKSSLSKRAIEKVLFNYKSGQVGQQYLKLYGQILKPNQ
jgi:glycosyltransferase involved in cell wall biosynthesis